MANDDFNNIDIDSFFSDLFSAPSLDTPIPDVTQGVSEARIKIRNVLRRERDLQLEGFRTKLNAYLYSGRDEMHLNDRWVQAFLDSCVWLKRFDKRQAFWQNGTSYAFKGQAERDMETYIPNGVFVAAAISEGFEYQRVHKTPNALLNIAYKRRTHSYDS